MGVSSYADFEKAKTYIGQTVSVVVETGRYSKPLRIYATLKDVTFKYGNVRCLVTPVAGSGEVWTEKVEFDAKVGPTAMDDIIIHPSRKKTPKTAKD